MARFPLIAEAAGPLRVRSCPVDGEPVCCDERGLAIFQKLRQRREEHRAFLFAFDLLELTAEDTVIRVVLIDAGAEGGAGCGRGTFVLEHLG
jgi:ATP-dependent DNA ligase